MRANPFAALLGYAVCILSRQVAPAQSEPVPHAELEARRTPRALVDQVYAALRDQLRSGRRIDAGAALQERSLAGQAVGVCARRCARRWRSWRARACSRPTGAASPCRADAPGRGRHLRGALSGRAGRPAPHRRAPAIAQTRAAIDAALADAERAHRAGDSDAFREANVRYRAAWLALVPNARLVRVVECSTPTNLQHIRALTLGDARVRSIVLRGLKRITGRASPRATAKTAVAAMQAHLQARAGLHRSNGLCTVWPAARRSRRTWATAQRSPTAPLEHAVRPLAGQPRAPAQRRVRGARGQGRARAARSSRRLASTTACSASRCRRSTRSTACPGSPASSARARRRSGTLMQACADWRARCSPRRRRSVRPR